MEKRNETRNGQTYVLAKRQTSGGDDSTVTIHGYTDDDNTASAWEAAHEDAVTFVVDVESPASFEPLAAIGQD